MDGCAEPMLPMKVQNRRLDGGVRVQADKKIQVLNFKNILQVNLTEIDNVDSNMRLRLLANTAPALLRRAFVGSDSRGTLLECFRGTTCSIPPLECLLGTPIEITAFPCRRLPALLPPSFLGIQFVRGVAVIAITASPSSSRAFSPSLATNLLGTFHLPLAFSRRWIWIAVLEIYKLQDNYTVLRLESCTRT
ncbi:hypothetical protein C8R44DRAFT_853655 [Mycena epipterygia]|nr:hypothetical protein C8R44DRAFT_853655 [Mycena epipterygia]